MTSKAFCPAHVTGFFTVSEPHFQPEKVGSRGAGFSLDLGAYATVELGGDEWIITVNDEKSSFLLVEKVLRNFAPAGRADIKTDVPFSQGLGMSGACALSAGLAVCAETGGNKEEAIRQAHNAEVFCRTGLGDVIAQSVGGFEVRLKEGLPPYGKIQKTEIEKELVIAVVGHPLITVDILSDVGLSEWIKMIGGECMEDFLPEDGFDRFIDISYRFAEETKFVKGSVRKAFEVANEYGKGSMCMIGNSVFFVGDTDKLYEVLSEITDRVFIANIDNQGARLIEPV